MREKSQLEWKENYEKQLEEERIKRKEIQENLLLFHRESTEEMNLTKEIHENQTRQILEFQRKLDEIQWKSNRELEEKTSNGIGEKERINGRERERIKGTRVSAWFNESRKSNR